MRNALLALIVLGSFGAFAEDKHEGTQLSNPILVDVRTDAEWNDGYIETAIHIPLDSILKKIESAVTDKEQIIYLYCRSGNRSGKATKILIEAGYVNAKNAGSILNASELLNIKIID